MRAVTSKPHALRAAMVSLLLPLSAAASEPSPDQIARIEALFGFDRAFDAFVERAATEMSDQLIGSVVEDLGPAAAGANPDDVVEPQLRAELKTCVAREMAAGFRPAWTQALRQQFVNGEYIDAWQTFSQTTGGGLVLSEVRQAMEVGGAARDRARIRLESAVEALPVQERAQALEFLRSPAGAVMKQPVVMADVDTDAVAMRVFSACVIDPESAAKLDELSERSDRGLAEPAADSGTDHP